MKVTKIVHQKTPRRSFQFLLILSLSIFLSAGALLTIQQAHATTAIYSLNVNSLNGIWPPPSTIENPVELAGNFSVYSGSGLEKQYGIMINWGDGLPDTTFRWYDPNNAYPYMTWNPNDESAQTFNGNFTTNPGGGHQDMGHIYAAEGIYNISIKLFHSQLGGSPGTVVGFSFIEHVLVAMLNVSRSAPAYARDGDLISYNVTVTNPSQSTPMYKISVIDSIFGNISNDFSSLLDPQKSESRTYNYVIPSPSGSIISSNVTASYQDAANHQVTTTAFWNVSVLHPNIAVTKAGPAYAHAGDIINYTITITNMGDCPLYNVTVNDTLLGLIALNGSLPAGQNQTLTLPYAVPATMEINDTATVSGFDILGLEVSATTGWSTTVQYQITIAASTSGAIGGTFNVTYAKEGIMHTDINGTTPWAEWVDSGTFLAISSPQYTINGESGIRYVFDSFDPSSNFVVTEPTNVTLMYTTQYYLIVSSAHDTPTPTSGWFDAGTNITASVSSPIAGLTGSQYASTGWSGSGSVPGAGSNTVVEFTIDAPSTLTWNWKTQYYLTIISPYATPVGIGWYDSGTTVYASLNTGTLVPGWGTRYVFDLWTGDASGNSVTSDAIAMNGPKTAVANWITQYYLTLTGNPLEVPTPTGAGWYVTGTNASVSTVDLLYIDSQSRWRFSGWVTGDMNKIMNSSLSSTTVRMDGPIIVTVNYDFQFKIVFAASANVRLDGTNTILYIDGVAKSARDLPFIMFVNRNQSISYNYVNPVASTLDGKRYRWDSTGGLNQAFQSNNLTVTESGMILGSYVDQYRVIIFSEHDSPSITAGQHWFDAGTSLTMSVTSPTDDDGAGTRYRFTGWTGTGSVPASGVDTTFAINVTAPSTLTWNWIAQYHFTVTSSHDSPTGEGWYDAGTAVSSSVTSPFTGEIGIRYVALGFTGTGSAPLSGLGAEVSFPINTPSTIAWSWKTQFLIIFDQTGLDTSATGTVIAVNGSPKTYGSLPFQEWIDNGNEVNYLYGTLVLSSQTGKRFTLVSTTGIASPINVTTPFRLVGNYKTQFYLTVTTAYATPNPSSNWFDAGTLISASVPSPFSGMTSTRYACTGWTGTGSIPSSGTGAALIFTISESSNLTWNWKTQYYLALSTNFGTTTPDSGWYDEDSMIPINSTAPTGVTWGYQWHGWTGLGTGSYSGSDNPASISLNSPISETSYWKAMPNLIVFVSNETIAKCDRISVHGTTTPVNSAVPLEIIYTFPNGKTITHSVLTDEEGRFTDTFLLENGSPYGVFAQGGQWVINVTRALDGNNEAATSYTTVGIKALDNNLFILAILIVSVTVAVVGSYLFMRKRITDRKFAHKAWRIATLALGLTGLVIGIIALMPDWMAVNGTALINGQTYSVNFSLNPLATGSVSITGIKYAGTPMPSLVNPAWSTVPRNPGPIVTMYLLPVGCALALASLYKPKTNKERTIKVILLMIAGALMLIPIVSSIIFMAVQSSVVTGASMGYAMGLFMAMIGGLTVLLSSVFAAAETPVKTQAPK